MTDDPSPEILSRIREHLTRLDIQMGDLSNQLTRYDYAITRESLYGVLGGGVRLNRHLLETLARVFDVPLSDLVTGSEYNELPEFPRRYSKVKIRNAFPKAPSSESWAAQKHYVITTIQIILDKHQMSSVSNKCSECVVHEAPCDTAIDLHTILKGLKNP